MTQPIGRLGTSNKILNPKTPKRKKRGSETEYEVFRRSILSEMMRHGLIEIRNGSPKVSRLGLEFLCVQDT